jgi:hypothetical protein
MLKRREFIKSSVVVATAASTGILSANAHPLKGAQSQINFVLVDEEIEDSVLFAETLIECGARSFSIQEDIGRLWFGELGSAFTAGHAIAGLTSHTELMVCTQFARQCGARLLYEGAHDCRGADVLTHSLRADSRLQHLSATLAAADAAWPRVLAASLAGAPTNESQLCAVSCRSDTRRRPSNPGSLFSWVIA